ncbi:Pentalenene oxygenase (plasmid) [Streptomyces sp. YIM 121038]|uniref:cytochrome P450 n=1 Tax=Streptomyces sp. YIM 121038 TaxID=2136401 RepID=UPI001110BBDB|nr:cytochrome P450 [Streptomyces sp. YIM 121038]QCX82600.1 Pentalenene oxygenase [Streptomyces sp. YIM 121038]
MIAMADPPTASGGLPLVGHIPALALRRLAFVEDVRGEGGLLRLRLGRTPAYLINDHTVAREVLSDGGDTFARGRFFRKLRPLVGNGLGTSDGAFHLRQRRMVQPVFHHSCPGYDLDALLTVIETRIGSWRTGMTLDVAREMDSLAVALITTTLFSSDRAVGEAEAIQASIADFMRGVGMRTVIPSDVLEKLPTPGNRKFTAARDRLENALISVIDTYRADEREHRDVLSMLMAARDERGQPMTDRELRDEVLSLLIAGGDTTGHTLGWAFHEVGRHPHAEQRLRDELQTVLDGGRVSKRTLPGLSYVRQVINEALRLHNPGWIVMRRTTRDVVLAGAPIPAGSELLISITALHRDPSVYPEPDTFAPDRWSGEEARTVSRRMFMPFGAGTRLCAGEPLARMSMALVLATVPTRFRLVPAPGARPVQEIASGTMAPSAMLMTLHPPLTPSPADSPPAPSHE